MLDYEISKVDCNYQTIGLNRSILGKEFTFRFNGDDLTIINEIIKHIVSYFESSRSEIIDNDTFGCFSWMIKFIFKKDLIELYELDPVTGNTYLFSLDKTESLLFDQMEICKTYSVNFQPALLNQKIAISKEIYSGAEVNAVRYDAPEHMTGWYLTSNNFSGDVSDLAVDHLYHILVARPELARFFCVPSGYRWFLDNKGYDVWKDED